MMEQGGWPLSEQQSGFIQGAWKWAAVNKEVGGLERCSLNSTGPLQMLL